MEAENLFLNNCGQRKVVEEFCELLPDFSIAVLAKALVVEAIPNRISKFFFLINQLTLA